MADAAETTIHLCLDVRGLLLRGRRELRSATSWIRKDDGSRYTVDELHRALLDELAQGHEVVPVGDCDNFDYKTGCRGHRAPAEVPA